MLYQLKKIVLLFWVICLSVSLLITKFYILDDYHYSLYDENENEEGYQFIVLSSIDDNNNKNKKNTNSNLDLVNNTSNEKGYNHEKIHEESSSEYYKHSSSNSTTYDENEYAIKSKKALESFTKTNNNINNTSTCAYLHVFWSGFCNQYFMFSGVLLLAQEANCTQLIVQTIRWKDLFGTNHQLRHDFLFDVVHWNTYYPLLPRFVSYDSNVYTDIQVDNDQDVIPKIKWNIDDPYSLATNPFAIGAKRTDAIMKFYDYTKDIDKNRIQRKESELLVMKGALRPHPAIRNIMTLFKHEHKMDNMMVLHARIEPDMQKHPMCKEYKVLNLTDIIDMLYTKYPEPPVSTVLIILNRAILEKEVASSTNDNDIASNNLQTLNEIISKGLWDGRVKVVEAGSELAKRSKYPMYSKYSSIVGSIINFFLSLEADIFVGTIVSSYSTSVISYRFFREKKQNYFYMPNGLDWVTSPKVKEPPRFAC